MTHTVYTWRIATLSAAVLSNLTAYKDLIDDQGRDGYKLAFAPVAMASPPNLLTGAQEPPVLIHYFVREDVTLEA